MAERSFIMIKPDGVQRGIVGSIVARFEAKGFQLLALRQMRPSREHLEKHYADLSSKGFFASLIDYMASSPVVAMVWAGDGVVKEGRKMLGATKPSESAMGTIRGDYCIDIGRNVCHGSDSVESAEHEIALWFPDGVAAWSHHSGSWVSERVAETQPHGGGASGGGGGGGGGSAMTDNLERKGKNSYYYWNQPKPEWTTDMAWDGNEAPRKLSGPGMGAGAGAGAKVPSGHHALQKARVDSVAAAAGGAAGAVHNGSGGLDGASGGAAAGGAGQRAPQVTRTPLDKYAWSDEAKKVKVYLDLPGVGALEDAAVVLAHTQDSVTVQVNELAGKNYSFSMELSNDIKGAKLRKKEHKLVLSLTKAGEYPWTSLRKE